MADDDTQPPPDPHRDPPARVPLTRADIPELVKAVVEAIEKTPKLTGDQSLCRRMLQLCAKNKKLE